MDGAKAQMLLEAVAKQLHALGIESGTSQLLEQAADAEKAKQKGKIVAKKEEKKVEKKEEM